MIVNRADLADIFGAAKTTVDQWRRDGCPVHREGRRGVPMEFDTVAIHRWLLNRNGDDDSVNVQLEREKLRKLRRENDMQEELVAPIDILTKAISSLASQVVPILDALPMEMKRRNPNLTGHDIHLVKKSIAKCRNLVASVKVEIDDD